MWFCLDPCGVFVSYQLAGADEGTSNRKKADQFLAPWRKKKRDWEAANVQEGFLVKVLGVFDTVGESHVHDHTMLVPISA